MALSKNYIKNVSGKEITFENTYIQIVHDDGNKNTRDIKVLVFDGSQKVNVVDDKIYTFVPSVSDGSPNFIKQGYEYLKTLVEYSDAIDC